MRLTPIRLGLILLIGGGYYGYEKYQDNKAMEAYQKRMQPHLEQVRKASQSHFTGAQVSINDAYPYDGPSYMEPYRIAKTIAVDLTIKGAHKGTDLDDLDIVDADTNKNYGSDPQMVGLDMATGQILPDQDKWPQDIGKLRMLAIFLVPKETKSIKLAYWGKELTTQSTALKAAPPAGRPVPTKEQLSGNPVIESQGSEKIIRITPQ